jgi:putative transposase
MSRRERRDIVKAPHSDTTLYRCGCSKHRNAEKAWRLLCRRLSVIGMIAVLSALISLLSFRLRSRASLELELIALRHQVTVLRRQRPGRPRMLCSDRLIWVWLYRIWPQALHAMVLVKPATVMQWHRKGFQLYWRWRSRSGQPGRPKTSPEIRNLIRQMSIANPLWSAPRIHGELLKLGIVASQATIGRYMPWRPKVPSPTWRSFLRNHMSDPAAVDMFVVATATFRLHYTVIVFGHDRRRIVHFDVTRNPTQVWLARQMTEAFPCCGIATHHMVRLSAFASRRWESRSSLRHHGHLGRTPTPSGSLARSAASVSITSSFFSERHLRDVLSSYFQYYNKTRTHLSLNKDCPESRPIHPPTAGKIIPFPEVGGLHHRYERRAA